MGKFVKNVFSVIVLLALIGACTDTEVQEEQQDKTEQVQETEVAEETVEVVEEETEVVEEVLPTVGEVAEAKKYSLVVNDYYETTRISSNNMFIEDLTTDGKFIVVNLTIKNKENTQTTYSDFDIKLKSGDLSFSATDNLDVVVIFEDYLSYEQVNPQMSTTNVLVFEVPSDLDTYSIEMGFFDTVEIILQ